ENQGLVSTIERVGTVRIEQKKKDNFEKLTFAEVINIVDGQVLGGHEGLHKTLSRFLIGAMQLEAIAGYLETDSLLIVGDRVGAHELALTNGSADLIAGGFDNDSTIKQLTDKKQILVMSTSYDTFTVAAMINRAIYDQMNKKEIVYVRDIFTPYDEAYYLNVKDKVEQRYELNERSRHTRFPVVDDKKRVKGMVTSKDIIDKEPSHVLENVMTKNPLVVHPQTSLAYVAHMMVWEGIEVVPVVDGANKLQGIISRQD